MKELVLPTFLQEEGFEVVEDEEGGDLVCSVCHGNNEQHLMIVCDTCNQRFHIGCLDPPLTKVPKKSAKWGWYVCYSVYYVAIRTPFLSSLQAMPQVLLQQRR